MSKGNTLPQEYAFWSEEFVREFQRVSIPVLFPKGSVVRRPGEPPNFLFMVESGTLNYRYFTEDGTPIIFLQKQRGDIFGLKAIFNVDCELKFFIVAETDVMIRKISPSRFLALLESNFEYSKNVIQYFSYTIVTMERKMRYSAALSPEQRLSLLLVDHATNIKNNTATVCITRQILAELLSTSRQSVFMYLSKLKDQGLISVQRGQIIILDWDALNRGISPSL